MNDEYTEIKGRQKAHNKVKDMNKAAYEYQHGITPDSLSGLIFGFEGIKNSVVLLNGPTGCKFYHGITVDNQSIRKDDFDPLNYPEEWYFGQGRVPCTYLDKRDYVYGSDGKLEDAIKFILKRTHPDLLAVVNSPGAALIGDDLERIVGKAAPHVITCQSPGYSKDISAGYIAACKAIIDSINKNCDQNSEAVHSSANEKRTASVNLLGLSIYHKYHIGDAEELSRLLGLCGIKVNCNMLCECTIDELRRIGDADLNIVVDPDYGLEISKVLENRFGTPCYVYNCRDRDVLSVNTSMATTNDISANGNMDMGANNDALAYPVGFKAMETLIENVCNIINANTGAVTTDPVPALADIEKARATAYIHISRMSSLTGLPKGVPFHVSGSGSMKRGYASFLTEYLGMKEVNDIIDADIVLADGNTIAKERALHPDHIFSGIEISLPTIGYIDVIQKTHLGTRGALLLIEQILNGLIY